MANERNFAMNNKQGDYTLGLHLMTDGIGYAANLANGRLLKAHGKNVIGVRKFEPGETAQDRRLSRSQRRRYDRRKWRLRLLNDLFKPELNKVDPTFLHRLKQATLKAEDRDFEGALLFPDDRKAAFANKYPTIYHLRNALMHDNQQHDIREVYLAVHHIVKYRGNFLLKTPAKEFQVGQLNLAASFKKLNELFSNQIGKLDFQLNLEATAQVSKLFDDQTEARQQKLKEMVPLLVKLDPNDTKTTAKQRQQLGKQFVNVLLGYKCRLNILLQHATTEPQQWAVNFEDFELEGAGFADELAAYEVQIIQELQRLYSQISLNQMLGKSSSLSESMIHAYQQHAEDADHLMGLARRLEEDGEPRGDVLRQAYINYLGHGEAGKLSQDDFYKVVKKNLGDSPVEQDILTQIDEGRFMPKLRSKANQIVPHQLHQVELDRIIEKQRRYYPFLKTLNPNQKHRRMAPYQLDDLVAFRVPYYIGPLITAADQAATSGAHFAWMVRKSKGAITPWNFEDKVDTMATANAFIHRMVGYDTYLPTVQVIPAASLLYEKFKVLNELNVIRVNGQPLSVNQKQNIYRDLFQKKVNVTVEDLQKYLRVDKQLSKPRISGLSSADHFNNGLQTAAYFRRTLGNKILKDPKLTDDLEKIVEWSTIFEDPEMYNQKMESIGWLTPQMRQKLINKRFSGWARLSKQLLTELKNKQGKSVMQLLWETNDNFGKIISHPDFVREINHYNNRHPLKVKNDHEYITELLNRSYTSPQVRKAINQTIKVVEDLVKVIGYAPTKIAIRMTHNPNRQTTSRTKIQQIQALYQTDAVRNVASDEVLQHLNQVVQSGQITLKEQLYFLQLGQDMYEHQPLNFAKLDSYTVGHILSPQRLADETLNNLVLISNATNQRKGNQAPVEAFPQRRGFWNQLLNLKLIGKRKFNYLIADPDNFNSAVKASLINYQLTETSQVVKLVAHILQHFYDDAAIIRIRPRLTTRVKQAYGLVDNPLINDYYLGMEAYLTALVGDYLYQRYPRLRSFFVDGQFKLLSNGAMLKNLRFFNFTYGMEHSDTVVDRETGDVIWDERMVEQLKKVFNYRIMTVSYETTTHRAELYNQTRYPAGSKRAAIPLKQGWSVEEYGGYSGQTSAWMALIAEHSAKHPEKETLRIVSIATRFAQKVERAKQSSKAAYQKAVSETIIQSGQEKPFRVLHNHLLFHQYIEDRGIKYTLSSAAYQCNAQQLWLSAESRETLAANPNDPALNEKELSEAYDQVFDEILQAIQQYFPLYQNKVFERLMDARNRFIKLPNFNVYDGIKLVQYGKQNTLASLLIGLHANSKTADLKYLLGTSTRLGSFQTAKGIVLSKHAKIHFQSPSGLSEVVVPVRHML